LLANTVSRVQSGIAVTIADGGPQPLRSLPLSAIWLDKPRELLIIENVAADPRLNERMRSQILGEGREALVIVPLRRGSQWQGLLRLSWPAPHKLTPDESFVLERLHE